MALEKYSTSRGQSLVQQPQASYKTPAVPASPIKKKTTKRKIRPRKGMEIAGQPIVRLTGATATQPHPAEPVISRMLVQRAYQQPNLRRQQANVAYQQAQPTLDRMLNQYLTGMIYYNAVPPLAGQTLGPLAQQLINRGPTWIQKPLLRLLGVAPSMGVERMTQDALLSTQLFRNLPVPQRQTPTFNYNVPSYQTPKQYEQTRWRTPFTY